MTKEQEMKARASFTGIDNNELLSDKCLIRLTQQQYQDGIQLVLHLDNKIRILTNDNEQLMAQISAKAEQPKLLLAKVREADIISTEPLAPEGTADWAWQMMLLKNSVIFPSKSCNNPPWSMQNGIAISAGLVVKSKAEWLKNATPTGWQLYEPKQELVKCEYCKGRGSYISSSAINPGYVRCSTCNGTGKVEKPAPAFKVGDWVEFIDAGGRKSQGKYLSNACDNTIFVLDITYNMRCVVPTAKIIRKLSPHEVVVHIGCLNGTVAPVCSDTTIMIVPIGYNGFGDVGIIPVAMLDTPTRELVRELIEKQEEGE